MSAEKPTSILSRGRSPGGGEAAKLRKAQVEQQIAEATVALLAEGRAFAELSIGQIATRAGISRSAFYNHYADKRELIVSLAEHYSAQLVEHVTTQLAGPVMTPEEAIRAMLRIAARGYIEQPHLSRALFEAASYDPVVRSWWDQHIDVMLAVARQQLVFEQAEYGRLPGIDIDIATYALHWMIHETFNQELVQHNRFEPDQVIDTVTQLLLRAIAAPAA